MRLIGLAVILAVGLPVAPLAVEAQPTGKVARVGTLSSVTPTMDGARYEAFRRGLRELGYVEGHNIVIESRYAEERRERLPGLAAELVRLNVDVILTAGDQAIRAAGQATQTIPIVVALAGDLIGPGYVASLARPGGNITGLTTLTPESSGKRLEFLKTAFPKVSRVAFLWDPTNAAHIPWRKETEIAAQALGVHLVSLEVRRPEDLDTAFRAALRGRADAVMAGGGIPNPARVVAFAATNRLPAVYAAEHYMSLGGLMFYGPNQADMYRRAATYVDKILKGAKPADLPVEQPTKFELVINLKTAKALDLTIPQTLLLRADHLIE
jgi:putative ABC transport system substrate-binding protein